MYHSDATLLDMLFAAWLEAADKVRETAYPTPAQLQRKHEAGVRYLRTMLEVQQARERIQARAA